MRFPLVVLLLAIPGFASAEGPGTRIRSSSQLPQPPQTVPRDASDACARLKGEAHKRCLAQVRGSRPDGAARDSSSGASGRR